MKTRPDDIRCTACRRSSGEPSLARQFLGKCDICNTKLTGFRICDLEWRQPWNPWILSSVVFKSGNLEYRCEHPRDAGVITNMIPSNVILVAREEAI